MSGDLILVTAVTDMHTATIINNTTTQISPRLRHLLSPGTKKYILQFWHPEQPNSYSDQSVVKTADGKHVVVTVHTHTYTRTRAHTYTRTTYSHHTLTHTYTRTTYSHHTLTHSHTITLTPSLAHSLT